MSSLAGDLERFAAHLRTDPDVVLEELRAECWFRFRIFSLFGSPHAEVWHLLAQVVSVVVGERATFLANVAAMLDESEVEHGRRA